MNTDNPSEHVVLAKPGLVHRASRINVAPRVEVDRRLAPSAKLVRFLDLPKLLHLVLKRSLFLTRLQNLMDGDPYECGTAKTYEGASEEELQSRICELEHYYPEEARTAFPPTSQLESKDLLWLLEKEELKFSVACCCFFQGEEESDAMWKIYANPLGVAVVTSVERLRNSIEAISVLRSDEEIMALEPPTVVLSPVKYTNQPTCDDQAPWLVKRMAFTHENEVRLYTKGNYIMRGLNVSVNLSTLIEKIVISPFAAIWEAETIERTIKSLLSGSEGLAIKKSEHLRKPHEEWPNLSKEFFDR